MTLYYSTQQIQHYEDTLITQGVTSLASLMDKAAHALFDVCVERIPMTAPIVVVCGKGHNAADGLLLACLLHQAGYQVSIYLLYDVAVLKPYAQRAFTKAMALHVPLVTDFIPGDYAFCIDAILGMGFHGNAVGDMISPVVHLINDADVRVISVDCPSGLHADSGAIADVAIRAELTICLLLLKRGLVTGDSFDVVGELVYADCQSLVPDLLPTGQSLEDLSTLASRQSLSRHTMHNVHKGNFGHVLIVGGNIGMHGAAVLAANAAARAGAGRVTVCVPDAYATAVPIDFTVVTLDDLYAFLQSSRITAVLVGPGLGDDDWARSCYALCMQADLPRMVIDADALNLLAENPVRLKPNWIMTPHQAEAARLLACDVAVVKQHRYDASKRLSAAYGGKVVLKGAGPIVQLQAHDAVVLPMAASALAVAGSGDVFAGIVLGLLAQHDSCDHALILATALHLRIGQHYMSKGYTRGLLASDMPAMIPSMLATLCREVY